MGITATTARGTWLKENLQNLPESNCEFFSKCTFDYNCIGLVTGDFLWWHPEKSEGHYWPKNIKRDLFASTLVVALQTAGFVVWENNDPKWGHADPDPSYQKIVILHGGGTFKHVSLQVGPDKWWSKFGELEDVYHPFDGILGGNYGKIWRYMRRKISDGVSSLPDEYRL